MMSRSQKMTEKGLQMSVERKQKRLRSNFKKLKELMKETEDLKIDDIPNLKTIYRAWIKEYGEYIQTYEELEDLVTEEQLIEIKTDLLLDKTIAEMRHFKQAIEDILQKPGPREADQEDDRSSIASRQSGVSRTSRSSRRSAATSASRSSISSEIKLKKAELQARAHALEENHKLQLERLALEKRQAELELQTEIAVCEAKNKILEDGYDDMPSLEPPWTRDELRREERKVNLSPTAPAFTPGVNEHKTKQLKTSHTERPHVSPEGSIVHEASCVSSAHALERIAELIAERDDSLPKKEPAIFKGDMHEFPSWLKSFETLVERKRQNPTDLLYYLGRYTEGKAQEAIKGLLILDNMEAYQQAKATLIERYGNKLMVAQTYKGKIMDWPCLRRASGQDIREFSDFLQNCKTAMTSIRYLQSLNSLEEMKKILEKLPKHIVDRWNRLVDSRLYQQNDLMNDDADYPTFGEFCGFLQRETRIMCGPNGMKEEERKTEKPRHDKFKDKHKNYTARTLKTEAKEVKNSQNKTKEAAKQKKDEERGTNKCIICEGTHKLEDCTTFQANSIEEKQNLMMKCGLCFGCLERGHRKQDCTNKQKCSKCGKLHPTLLHDDNFKPKTTNPSATVHRIELQDSEEESVCTHSMIIPVELYHSGNTDRKTVVYALLDEQSDACFIKESVMEGLQVKGMNVQLNLSTMLATDTITCKKVSGMVIKGLKEMEHIKLPTLYSRQTIPAQRSQIPIPETVDKWTHLQGMSKELHPLKPGWEIGLLIGINCSRALRPVQIISGKEDDPYAIKTAVGWGVVGVMKKSISHRPHFVFRTQVKELSPLKILQMFNTDFNERKTNERLSQEDNKFLKIMSRDIEMKNGQFELPLPKKGDVQLNNNKASALQRLNGLRRKFKDKLYLKDYTAFMEDLMEKGYAEEVPTVENENQGKVWYLPHHRVYNPKKPEKVRIVFDCSARYNNQALNDYLLQGPDLTNNLIGVLCRFRKDRIAFTCDIANMFHQVKVKETDRDLLRFLWWEGGDTTKEPKAYRMTVHLFGATSSPGCANFALKSAADKCDTPEYEDAANFIRNDFYVDDGLKSVGDPKEATNLIRKAQQLCKESGFHLHKFLCNDKEVLKQIPTKDRGKEVQSIDLNIDNLPIERTLGVQWCIESDSFRFRIQVNDKPLTRRGILSTVSSVFDPLGLVAPFILTGKTILQDLCKEERDWDEPVSEDTRSRWEKWRSQLPLLAELVIPRCYKGPKLTQPKLVELHHFSDASLDGIGQCSYLRLIDNNGNVSTTLVMAKARVAPTKSMTVPRLELTAALTSARVSNFLMKELQYEKMVQYFWTDSKVVLGYINNDAKRFHIFVANRVQEIRDYSRPSEWGHIETKQNPADLASRGLSAQDLKESDLWWKGPPILLTNEMITTGDLTCCTEIVADDPEVRRVTAHATQAEVARERSDILDRFTRISDWSKIKRIMALCLRYRERLRLNKGENYNLRNRKGRLEAISVEEQQAAEKQLLRLVQERHFHTELAQLRSTKNERRSDLHQLDPYICKDGLLRVGGRIKHSNLPTNVLHPLLLPKEDPVTKSLLAYYHSSCGHGGRGMTINTIRSHGYWITGIRAAVTSHIWKCVTCRRLRGPPLQQKMADLPKERLEPAPPFTYSAVDYFGPFLVKEGRKTQKRYGALFTCLLSRAVHLEVANEMTTDSFLNAYRRFVCRRGRVRQLRSDRGTNFVGARAELEAAMKKMDQNKIKKELNRDQCDFIDFYMNPPHASHRGGIWERMIRSVRNILEALLMKHGDQLDDEALRTLMTEVECILNNRPITYLDTNPGEPLPLTPSHLLTMKTNAVLPPPGKFTEPDLYSRKRWRRVQHLANCFWTRWSKEYLLNLQRRQKWIKAKPNVKEGDVVLIVEEVKRNEWRMGRVMCATADQDGLVRKATVKSGDSILERPVQKLVLLISETKDPVKEPK